MSEPEQIRPRGPRYAEEEPRASRIPPRQQLVAAVVAAVVASSLALFAASRTWLVRTTVRPAPAPPMLDKVSGASLVPLLPALALVALAGAGAVVATRGRWRSVVGVVITGSGLGIVILQRSPARMDGIASGWVLVSGLCGVAIAVVGAFTLRNGARWPAMGSRYDRPAPRPSSGQLATADTEPGPDERSNGSDQAADAPIGRPHTGDTAWWDAIDRGEDPTKD